MKLDALLKKPLWLYAAVSVVAVVLMALASAVWAPQLQQWEERLASRTWSLANPNATERRVVVVDGFIATAAVLVAHAMCPNVLVYCIFAHQSGEQGHRNMLKYLNAQPLLDLGMRLGEGSGAALAWPLLVSACALLRDMASFDSASVSRADLSTSTTSAKASLE